MSKKHKRKKHHQKKADVNIEHDKGVGEESSGDKGLYIFSGALVIVIIAVALIFTTFQGTPAGDESLICDESNQMCNTVAPSGTGENTETPISATEPASDVKVEVYHFHGTHQCYSCTMVGDLAEKTVNTYFKDELESGKIVFGHVNGELPENAELVNKYGATGSSLWIGTYIDGEFHKEQNTRVWYKISNEKDYLEYLKGVLEKRLNGELD